MSDAVPSNQHLVPGVMRCAKCSFRLVRTNLHVYSGNFSAGDNKTEPCPNGCGPLWPETWEQRAREAEKVLGELMPNGSMPLLVPCPRCDGTGKLKPYKLDGDTEWRIDDCPVQHVKATQPRPAAPALRAYDEAMQAAGVPQEPLQVYDSNSWRRVGLVREYREVMAPTVAPDRWPDIRGTDVLRALVAAFNAMLELRRREGAQS